jgi:hypothetical protein
VSFAVFACVTGAGTANAQWARQTTFDVGGIRLTRDDFADTGGIAAAALWSRWNDRVSLTGSGAATHIADGRSTGVILGSASYSVPIRRVRLETGGTATILGTSNQAPASSVLGAGRAHWLGRAWGTWLGAGGGKVRVDETTFGAGTGELGAWLRRGDQRLTLSATTVRTSLVSTVIFSDETVLRIQEPVRYADVALGGHGAWGRLELDALAISRHAWKGELVSAPTAAVGVAWWATRYMAVAGALGRQLADPLRGTARTRYATVALRFSAERHGPARVVRALPAVPVGEASLLAVPGGGGTSVVRVHAPGAQRVELMSDVTAWTPVVLERRGDHWEARLTMASGSHHVVVRMDGGRWVAPANLSVIDDDFGGRVGLIVIP